MWGEEIGTAEQKKEERKSVEKLKNKLTDFPRGEIIEDERPDFLIKSRNKTFGIEVTRIFKNTNEDDLASLADDYAMIEIVEKAKQICENNNILPLEVSVQFNNHKNFHRIDKIPIIIALANLVALNIPDQNSFIEIINDFRNPSFVPDVIHSLTIANFNLNVHHWNAPTFGWVQETFEKELQETIFNKNEKLKNYLRKCEECWLLIDAPGDTPTSFFDPNEKTINHLYEFSFNRVFFVGGFLDNYFELKSNCGNKND